jgi:hypothetical protein
MNYQRLVLLQKITYALMERQLRVPLPQDAAKQNNSQTRASR